MKNSSAQRPRWRDLWPILTADQVKRAAAYGTPADLGAGDIVFRADRPPAGLIIVESGTIDVSRGPIRDLPPEPVVTHGPGRFVGEFSLFTGQTLFLTARMTQGEGQIRV